MTSLCSNIIPLFSTPLYSNNLQVDNEVKEFIRKVKYIPIVVDGDVNGYTSESFHILEEPELYTLKKDIDKHINNFLHYQLNFTKNIKFNIQTSWLVKHTYNNYSQLHHHNNSLYSGVVYLQVDDNSGDIVFINNKRNNLYPTELTLDVDSYNLYNAQSWIIKPKNHDIFIFPSHLQHKVTPSKSLNDRYVLAFNVFPSGTLNKGGVNELVLL
jgi:uncharacterized protein (TIGR02466 family)